MVQLPDVRIEFAPADITHHTRGREAMSRIPSTGWIVIFSPRRMTVPAGIDPGNVIRPCASFCIHGSVADEFKVAVTGASILPAFVIVCVLLLAGKLVSVWLYLRGSAATKSNSKSCALPL